ncbi:unnamed protein product [Clonostachys rosea f. rosea IK726]|nr:unnamed protein product [Clonostachys rosea f. rosea IK726]
MNRRSISDASERSCEGLTAEDTRELWRCMLELQGLYGCYTSARIDVAMEAGEQGVNLMPNRFIIDTLNSSVLEHLPQDGLEKLNRFLCHTGPPSPPAKRSHRPNFFKRSAMA